MSTASEPSRRTILAAVVAGAMAAGAASPAAAATPAARPTKASPHLVDYRAWTSYPDWRSGSGAGVRAVAGLRPGVVMAAPAGRADYTDPHTGRTTAWEYAVWTSPVHRLAVPSTEAVASWNAYTPAGTWLQVELTGTYSDGTDTPWYVMGRWAAGDQDIRRTSVDGQSDGRSSVWTDTFSVDDASTGLRLVAYRLRLTLYRTPGSRVTPTVWRLGAMGSAVPDRFTVPASTPGLARELK